MEVLNIEKIRADFPILHQSINGNRLIYFDNAATTQKPIAVINSITECYSKYNANIHRAVHYLSQKSTDLYEEARQKVAQFINAKSTKNIVFTSGTTEGINTIASSLGYLFNDGDEIIISEMEHHANIVPWLILKEKKAVDIKYLLLDNDFQLQIDKLKEIITDRTKLIAITHVSNTLGTINPIETIIDIAKEYGIAVLIDAAQSIQHLKIDVQQLECDFLVFSGHKIYAETGIGVLYIDEKWHELLPPYKGGGDMIEDVDFFSFKPAQFPLKFEAGTTNYVGAISLGAAIDYIQNIGLDKIATYEKFLHNYLIDKLQEIKDLQLYVTQKPNRCSVVSFNVKNIHHTDIGQLFDNYGIAVRTGGHCTYPLLKKLGITGTVRASLAFYNTPEEIDIFVDKLQKVVEMLK